MVGAGEAYLVAFSLEKGFGPIQAGLLLPLCQVMGAFLPLAFTSGLAQGKSLKKFVLQGAGAQVLVLLIFVFLSFQPLAPWSTFLIVSLYFFTGYLIGPSWNGWLSQLVKPQDSSRFFEVRLRLSQVGLLMGLAGAGFFLHYRPVQVEIQQVFAVIFGFSALVRAISVFCLRQQPDSPAPDSFSFLESFKNISKQKRLRSFFGFLFFFYIVIAVSSPFVNPFLLKELKLNYEQYMGAIAALYLAKFLIFPWGAKWIAKYGTRKVLLVGALGISPLPALWVLVSGFWGSFALQFASGLFWGLFEMGFSVIFFNHLTTRERIPVLTLYALFNTIALFVGGLMGALLLKSTGYDEIFTLGSFLRVGLVLLVAWKGSTQDWPQEKHFEQHRKWT